jgi:hypothetical protein
MLIKMGLGSNLSMVTSKTILYFIRAMPLFLNYCGWDLLLFKNQRTWFPKKIFSLYSDHGPKKGSYFFWPIIIIGVSSNSSSFSSSISLEVNT